MSKILLALLGSRDCDRTCLATGSLSVDEGRGGRNGWTAQLHRLDLETSVSACLLQTAAHREAANVSEAFRLRRTDVELRLNNSRLKTELTELTEQLVEAHWSRHELHMDFRKPLWLTLLVTAILLLGYLVIYFIHLVAFFSHRNSVRVANRRRPSWEAPEPVPKFEDYNEEVIKLRFCLGLRRKTVHRLIILLILITASGSYFASQGYFKPLEEKLVPFLYLGLVAILIGQAVLREVWQRNMKHFGPMIETMTKFSEAMQNFGENTLLKDLRESLGRVADFSG
ncbi:unnamed protein product [Durusdinium trenchii]|uniref:Uncharacterized protein n=1 Tax=Durusdinium trenchii TaxID=1381693 RepID=A0ABP0QSC4_9DINO